MTREIVLKLQGGMGNQMFQYALGRSLQKRLNAKLILDISDFQYDKVGRRYVLSHFRIPDTIELDDSGKFNILYDWRKNVLIKAGTLAFPNLLYKVGSHFGRHIWEETDYKELDINPSHSRIMIHGYWQSERYFEGIANDIRNELQVKEDECIRIHDQLQKIRNTNSIAIHLRRSDFLKKKNTNHVISLSYYHNAMERLESIVRDPVYYVFSDDISWVIDNLKPTGKSVEFINGDYTDYEEFQLMSECNHFIIANSTFSWWGSFVGEKNDSIIIAPDCWYDDGRDVSALIRKKFTIVTE